MRFIAFDLETTGTVAAADTIVEIGAVRFIDGNIDALFSTLVDPCRSIPPGASRVNGISDAMVKGKPTIDKILEPFADFCGEDLLIAHNAPFDTQFLVNESKKHALPAPRGIVVDTLPMARKILPGLPNHKLGTLIQHLKIPNSNFHRAEADATYAGKLFLELVKRISVNGNPPALDNIITLTGKPAYRFPVIIKRPKQLDLIASF